MTDSSTAIVIHGAGDIRVEQRPARPPRDGEVAVAVAVGGICGSDLSYYRHGAVGDFRVKAPMILGHEVVGTVTDGGSGVDRGWEGRRVAVDPSTPCQRCARCREGRSNACLNPTFLGSASTDPHVDGGFASRILTSEQNLVEIPDAVAWQDVVFAEPLAVNVHALARAGGADGKRVLVVGAGPIGCMAAAAARRLGAREVVVTDVAPDRLTIAAQLGVDGTVLAGDPTGEFDLVIEASGSAAGISSAIEATRKAGTLVLVGLPHGGPLSVPVGLTVTREIDIYGSFRFCHDEFVTAVDLLAGGLDLSPLHTDSYAATDAGQAFETACGAGAMKVQLTFTDE